MIFSTLNAVKLPTTIYHFAQINTLGGAYTHARAINENGAIAGDSYLNGDIHQHAFLFDNGNTTDIGTQIVGMNSIAQGLNNNGLLVGHASSKGQLQLKRKHQAFSYDQNTQTLEMLGTLGGDSSFAYDVNDHREIVGYAHTEAGTDHAFLYDNQRQVLHDLGTLGGLHSVAYAINNQSQIVGYASVNITDSHAFVYIDDEMHDLGTLGGSASFAYDINEHGVIIGSAYNAAGEDHAFMYDMNSRSTMQDLGTLGGMVSVANGINNHKQIVGYSFLKNNSDAHAFLYHNEQMIDLNVLLDQQARQAGWVLNEALSINDHGDIIGIAYNNQLSIHSCAFLLSVDEKASRAYIKFLTNLGFKTRR